MGERCKRASEQAASDQSIEQARTLSAATLTPCRLPRSYVTADCDADADVFYSHHYGATPSDSVRLIVTAGTDIDCGGFMTDEAPRAVADGNVTQEQLDVLLRRLFRVRLRLGHFDPPGPLQTIGVDQICSNYSVEVARDGARQGTVLLKNDGRLLPLLGAYQRVAVIGPLMDQRDNTYYYGGTPCFNAEPCPLDSVQQHVASAVVGLHGVPSVSSNDTSGIAAAAAAAADADLVIMVVGSDLSLEVEGHDRLSIAFSDAQLALVAAVAVAAKGPIVVQVHSGGAMDVAPLLANAKVGAVVHAGQPSVQVPGVGDILFGRTPDGRAVAPAGRMSQVWRVHICVRARSHACCSSHACPRLAIVSHADCLCRELRGRGLHVRLRHAARPQRVAPWHQPWAHPPLLFRHAHAPLRLRAKVRRRAHRRAATRSSTEPAGRLT